MKKIILPTLAALLSCSASAIEFKSFIDPQVWSKPFQEVSQVACHNCYEEQYAPSIYDALSSVRTLEIDFYDDRDLNWGAYSGNWFVRHGLTGGNHSNCSGQGNLQSCLNDVRRWSDDHPGHFPITIILDKKQGFSDRGRGREPSDLDSLVSNVLGSKLYTPKDLKHFTGKNGGLRHAVSQAGWPTTLSLSGKIILVLNGSRNEWLNHYANARKDNAKIFISPATNGQNDITGTVSGMNSTASSYVVMNNMSSSNKKWSREVLKNNHIGRVWGNDGQKFEQQIAHGSNISAYYKYKTTKDTDGYRIRPFVSQQAETMFVGYSENNLKGNIVCTFNISRSLTMNFKKSDVCENDEIRSVSLLNMKRGRLVELYDSPSSSTNDDFIIIRSRTNDSRWININNLEQNQYNSRVNATFYRDNGLNGKVSSIKVK